MWRCWFFPHFCFHLSSNQLPSRLLFISFFLFHCFFLVIYGSCFSRRLCQILISSFHFLLSLAFSLFWSSDICTHFNICSSFNLFFVKLSTYFLSNFLTIKNAFHFSSVCSNIEKSICCYTWSIDSTSRITFARICCSKNSICTRILIDCHRHIFKLLKAIMDKLFVTSRTAVLKFTHLDVLSSLLQYRTSHAQPQLSLSRTNLIIT